MKESVFLGGLVRKHTLAMFPGPAGPDAPPVKRLLLPQGELAQFHDAEWPAHYIAFIELQADTLRGNHYHKTKEEWIYLIRGEMEVIVENVETKARALLPVQSGDLVQIQTGIAHALRITQAGQAVEFSPARYDPADTYRYPLV